MKLEERIKDCEVINVTDEDRKERYPKEYLVRGGHRDSIGVLRHIGPDRWEAWHKGKLIATRDRRSRAIGELIVNDDNVGWEN